MKRFIAVLSGLLVLPAFAEVAPIFYDDVIEYTDQEILDDEFVVDDDADADANDTNDTKVVIPTKISPRSTSGRTATSRAIPSSTTGVQTAVSTGRTTTSTGRGVSTRTTSANTARTASSTASRASTARATVSRAATTSATPATTSESTGTVSTRRATNTASGTTAARASIIQTDTVNTPLYTGRVGVRSSSSVTSRVPTIRMATASSSLTDTSTVATTTADMDELAEITDFCKAQYTQCMDNFCNVLDDNQGRCSCSANLKNYEKTENALKQATEDLQDVAQKIQYIGLSGDEVETLFKQTEAELAMQNTTDNTQLKNDLDKIKNMIVDVKSGTATASDSGISLDLSGLLDFTVSSTGFDLSSFLGTSSSTSSISNQRGETLYKTASARCKASVLNSCSAQGVDVSIITNAYDLEIDKQCIAYERSLTDSNEQMTSTVRNAKSVLQKARLLVAQQKNTYDLRGCINALDTCMQDDFVCGSDYENCLDPTGKYIVNGEIVSGSLPGVSGGEYDTTGKAKTGLYSVWDYGTDNAWNSGTIGAFIDENVPATFPVKTSTDMATYLQGKIGYIDSDGKAQGMCVSVLNKCQDYTYTTSGSYKTDNDVVRGFLERVLIQIKSAQDELLAEEAENCVSDVASCLSQNNNSYYSSYYSSYNSSTNPSEVAIKACRSVIETCKSLTERSTSTKDVYQWLDEALGTTLQSEKELCTRSGGTWAKATDTATTETCSCPTGKTLDTTTHACK